MEIKCDACWLPPGAGNQLKMDVCFHIRAAQALLSKEAWKEGVPLKPQKGATCSHLEHCFSWGHLFFNSSTVICHLWRGEGAGRVTNVCFSLRDPPTGLLANGETNRRRWLRPSWCGEYQSTYVWLQRQHGRGCATMLLRSITFSMLG